MPAAVSPTMIAATTQSTTMQNGGHHRVLATKWLLPEVLEPVPRHAGHEKPRRFRNRGGGHHDEGEGHGAFDRDDLRPSVGDGEADVDEGDRYEPQRVNRGAIQPPEGERGCRLQEADHDPPQHGRAERARRSGRGHRRVSQGLEMISHGLAPPR